MRTLFLAAGVVVLIVTSVLAFYCLKPARIELADKDRRAISALQNLSVATDVVARAGKLDAVNDISSLIAGVRSVTQNNEFTEDDRFDPWGDEWSFHSTRLGGMVLVRIQSDRKPWYATQLVYRNGALVEYTPLFFFLGDEENSRINKREKECFMVNRGYQ